MGKYGSCCCCGADNGTSIIKLPVVCPQPGTGWGCADCGVPFDGAIAIVCDGCKECTKFGKEPVYVVNGSVKGGRRVPYDADATPFIHTADEHFATLIGGRRRINDRIPESLMMATARMN